MECGTDTPFDFAQGRLCPSPLKLFFLLLLGDRRSCLPKSRPSRPMIHTSVQDASSRISGASSRSPALSPAGRGSSRGVLKIVGGTLLSVAVGLIVDLSFHRSSNPVVRSCGRPIAKRAKAYFKQHFKAFGASPPLPSRARYWRHSRHRTRPRPRSRQ